MLRDRAQTKGLKQRDPKDAPAARAFNPNWAIIPLYVQVSSTISGDFVLLPERTQPLRRSS